MEAGSSEAKCAQAVRKKERGHLQNQTRAVLHQKKGEQQQRGWEAGSTDTWGTRYNSPSPSNQKGPDYFHTQSAIHIHISVYTYPYTAFIPVGSPWLTTHTCLHKEITISYGAESWYDCRLSNNSTSVLQAGCSLFWFRLAHLQNRIKLNHFRA